MKLLLKRFIKSFLNMLRPMVWHLAEFYDLRIECHCRPTGQNPLVIEDFEVSKRHNIPKSCIFNTRSGKIVIGRNTVFGEYVQVLTGMHYHIGDAEKYNVPLHHVPENGRDIIIGNGCYIGSSAIIIGPCKVGDNAVIGAGAVVTKDVEPRTFVAGVPAKFISRI